MIQDISFHLADIVMNSIRAGANEIEISICAFKSQDLLTIEIKDNGSGMKEDLIEKVQNPFFTTRTTRKIGLGIPLLKESAEMSGGNLQIFSTEGKGTEIKAVFYISNVDRIPLGDIGQTYKLFISSYPERRFILILSNQDRSIRIDTAELSEKLQEVPLNNPDVLKWINEYVDEGVKEIFGGALNEVIG